MAFPPKKPDDEKPAPADKPAPFGQKPEVKPTAAPADKPAPFGQKPAPTDKPAPAPSSGGAKPSAAPAPSASGNKGGSSAPLTPGQSEPDVKPHDQPGAKKEPEESPASNKELPPEAKEGHAAAKEKPKGLPSLASMDKPTAEKSSPSDLSSQNTGGAPMDKLLAIVEALALMVAAQKGPAAGPAPMPGAKPGMPGAPQPGPMPGMQPGAKPGMPGAQPGMQPGMPGAKPGMPGQMPGSTGGPTVAPMPRMTMEQFNSVMTIVDAVNAGRLPRPGAAILIASMTGLDPKSAEALVTPDKGAASPPGTPGANPPGEAPELDENGDPVEPEPELDEYGDPIEPTDEAPDGDEPVPAPGPGAPAPAPKAKPAPGAPAPAPAPGEKKKFGSKWDFKKLDSEIDTAIQKLEARRDGLTTRLDAMTIARDIALDTTYGDD